MKVYDLLFYSAYNIAKKSSQYGYAPVFYGALLTSICVMINVFTLLVILSKIINTDLINRIPHFIGGILSFSFPVFVVIYYKFNARYLKIQNKYGYIAHKRGFFYWCIFCLYYVLSFGLNFVIVSILK